MSGEKLKNEKSLGGYIDANIACDFKIKTIELGIKHYTALEIAAMMFCNEVNRRNGKEPEYVIPAEFHTTCNET